MCMRFSFVLVGVLRSSATSLFLPCRAPEHLLPNRTGGKYLHLTRLMTPRRGRRISLIMHLQETYVDGELLGLLVQAFCRIATWWRCIPAASWKWPPRRLVEVNPHRPRQKSQLQAPMSHSKVTPVQWPGLSGHMPRKYYNRVCTSP